MIFFINDYKLLVSDGNIGFYNSCEVTEIFLYNSKDKTTCNFYTIVSFEEKIIEKSDLNENFLFNKLLDLKFINDNDINTDYKLGISQYNLCLNDIKDRFTKLKQKGKWKSLKEESSKDYSKLNYLSKQFVSSDDIIRLNKCLKNNFFNGSYILEFFEEDKSLFNTIFAEDSYFDEICSKIRKVIPINLYALEDRLGNFIFQFPVNILDVNYRLNENSINFNFQWNSKIKEFPDCFIEISSILDGNINSYIIEEYNKSVHQDIFIDNLSNYNIKVFDKKLKLLLYVNNYQSVNIDLNIDICDSNQRYFEYCPPSKSKLITGSVPISEKDYSTKLKRNYKYYIDKSNNKIEKEKLEKDLSFKFYNQTKDALNDLRTLIKKHGRNGVYLWDPYLTPEDIINTLFFSEVSDVPLKALGSLNKTVTNNLKSISKSDKFNNFIKDLKNIVYNPSKDSKLIIDEIKNLVVSVNKKANDISYSVSEYKKEFSKINGNFDYKLNLEFRVQYGSYGYNFHDRLLIFPGNPNTSDGPKVFSLGTSVNSFGKNYHILQEVSYPQAVITEFNKLWDELDHEECIIWKSQK